MAPGGKDSHLSPMPRSGPGPERIDRFASIFLRNFNHFRCYRNSEQHCETQHVQTSTGNFRCFPCVRAFISCLYGLFHFTSCIGTIIPLAITRRV